jgi:protease IV
MKKAVKMVLRPVAVFWKSLTSVRRFIGNVVFLILIVLAGSLFFGDRGPKLPESAVLVLDPAGSIVEQTTETLLSHQILGEGALSETLLRDVVDGIDQAAADRRIKGILLELDRLEGTGLSKLQEIGAALMRFRTSGKFVIARSDFFSQREYYLAVHADRVYLHPMGLVMLTGFGVFHNYYKTALDKLMVRFHVFKVGTYKSALEPFTRNDMSDNDRQANAALLTALWENYKKAVSSRRGLSAAAIDDYISGFPTHLAAVGGDAAQLAVKFGLVDDLKTRDEVDAELVELVGKNRKTGRFNRIGFADYVDTLRVSKPKGDPKVAVVVARGTIREGVQPAGSIGGESLSALIRATREDRAVKALVVRIDSPGGSAFASELIRREIELTRRSGKPVVVSMSSTAASGGYWIASAADEIWAYPTTVTGSIGIFGAFPTFEESLKALGINNDGFGTTPLADAFNPNRPMNALAAAALQQIIEQGYRTFIRTVAQGRNLAEAEVEGLAQGRIWSGEAAVSLGLVDKIGNLQDAVRSAAEKAGLSNYQIDYAEPELTARERVMKQLNRLLLSVKQDLFPRSVMGFGQAAVGREWMELLQLVDSRGIYAFCPNCFQPE